MYIQHPTPTLLAKHQARKNQTEKKKSQEQRFDLESMKAKTKFCNPHEKILRSNSEFCKNMIDFIKDDKLYEQSNFFL